MGRDKERALPQDELTEPGGKLRLYVEAPLAAGVGVAPTPAQAHYLLHVMRAKEGTRVLLFNGRDGEWRARLAAVTRKACALVCESAIAPQEDVPDLWLAFAPVKKTPADYVAQKATELGVRALQPVITHRTIARRVNLERLRANAIEAAEQSGRLSVPEIREPRDLDALLGAWPKERRLIFCDEGGNAAPIADALMGAKGEGGSWGVLTGPEGGFDDGERAAIRACPFVLPVTLGPRIVRADTAALAALAVWQAICGDWRQARRPAL
ncbi:MAG: 16S rRNA (uracil(1498)-N(3))-methyltransferase [Alphaproteobacteria bacterium]|nr:16S rRNA (uracil(1498)-N(3))-methyltransferase [Alphaproteobacteria bacterium]